MKENITCLIVDDEPLAQNLLRRYVDRLSHLRLIGVCDNALQALDVMHRESPDILFLDINMPEISGMQLVKMLGVSHSGIILTTAYPNYAVESYDFAVTDYLLKPISFDRFVKAVSKVSERSEIKDQQAGESIHEIRSDDFFMVRSDRKLVRINVREIMLVEGMKDYLKIHLSGSVVIVHMTIGKMEQLLEKRQFLRVNKSYIINMREIKILDGNEVELSNKQKVVIGATYRERIFDNLHNRII